MSITKVAKLAGVSSSTVSRVINNHPRVAPDTEDTVRKVMRRLNYTPSERRPGPKPKPKLASTLKSATFLVFGASGDQAAPAFADLLRGVSIAGRENDVDLSFSYVPDLKSLPTRLLDEDVDGLLLHGAMPQSTLEQRLRKIPTVWLMGNRQRPLWGDQVMPNSFEVGHLAADYLAEQGHKHVAFLNLDAEHWSFQMYRQSFLAGANSHGATAVTIEEIDEPSKNYWHRYSARSVDSIITRFLSIKPRPTGLFVADAIQLSMLQPALQARGIELGGGRTQIVTCNNEAPFLAGLTPSAAVIDIRVESIGLHGVDQLLWRIAHPNREERLMTWVEPRLIVSLSTDAGR